MNQKTPKKYEDLVISDDFMFGKVMSNKKLCKRMLEILLDIEIENIEYPELQKSINITYQGKSVRLDAYVEDEKKAVYNAEMQKKTYEKQVEQLPKRSRYYQGMIDLNLIQKGALYQELSESYILFICTFDPFGEGKYRYTFKNICLENNKIILDDKTTKVFLNTKGHGENISQELKSFLKYVDTQVVDDDFTKELDKEVTRVRYSEEWRREYMKTFLHDMEMKEEGTKEGIKLTKQVLKLSTQGKNIDEIAKECEIDTELVKKILE